MLSFDFEIWPWEPEWWQRKREAFASLGHSLITHSQFVGAAVDM